MTFYQSTKLRAAPESKNDEKDKNNKTNKEETLWATQEETKMASKARFGDVVEMKRPGQDDSASSSSSPSSTLFPESSSTTTTTSTAKSTNNASKDKNNDDPMVLAKRQRNRNRLAAIVSLTFAVLNFTWQYTHPVTPLQLLATMQQQSQPLSVIGTNGKPTVVDFWAPWCDNCKLAASTLQAIEQEYEGKVNFCMVNGDANDDLSWKAIDAFGVDAIPHLALVTADGVVQTALVGPVPKYVLQADLDALLQDASALQQHQQEQPQASSRLRRVTLPYTMLDVFSGRPEKERIVHFDPKQ